MLTPSTAAFEERRGRLRRPGRQLRHQMRRVARRDLADRHEPLAGLHVEARHRPQEGAQIRVRSPAKNIVERAALHDLALIHDDDFLGDIGDNTEVMRDQEHGHAELRLQFDNELQDLRLDRHVERGGRLVRDQERRAAHQRHRDHRALAQPARQFEGITAPGALRVGKADKAQHVGRQLFSLGGADRAVQLERLADLVANRVQGRQRAHRLLEDDRDPPAADRPHRGPIGRQLHEVDDLAIASRVGKPDRAPHDPAVAWQDAQDALADDRFPRAAFADQRDGRRRANAEIDALDRVERSAAGREADVQILDAEQVVHRTAPVSA
jgi:hypothetical protein